MTELALTRTPDDRRRYVLGDLGDLRLRGLFSSRADLTVAGTTWQVRTAGLIGQRMEAHDGTGAVVGEFVPRGVRRGGTLRWQGRELQLRPVSAVRHRFALVEGDREVAVLEAKSWGRTPVRISSAERDAALLLFAAFVLRHLATTSDSAAGAATTSTASSG